MAAHHNQTGGFGLGGNTHATNDFHIKIVAAQGSKNQNFTRIRGLPAQLTTQTNGTFVSVDGIASAGRSAPALELSGIKANQRLALKYPELLTCAMEYWHHLDGANGGAGGIQAAS